MPRALYCYKICCGLIDIVYRLFKYNTLSIWILNDFLLSSFKDKSIDPYSETSNSEAILEIATLLRALYISSIKSNLLAVAAEEAPQWIIPSFGSVSNAIAECNAEEIALKRNWLSS